MDGASSAASRILLVNPATQQTYPSAPSGAVHLASAPYGWRGILAELHRIPPLEMESHQLVGHRLIVNTGRHATPFGWKLGGGKVHETFFRPGEFALQTHGDRNSPRWSDPFEFMAFALEPDFVAEVAGHDHVSVNSIEFQPRRGHNDPVITRFAEAFRQELAQGNPNGALYAEALTIGFILHLLTHYGVRCFRNRIAGRGKLSAFQVRRVIDYVQAHLGESFSIRDMADQANLSVFHFARLFRATLGLPPHRYVVRLRVERARSLLTQKNGNEMNLAQVAFAVGFFDQAHLTHAFRRFLGATPKAFGARRGRSVS